MSIRIPQLVRSFLYAFDRLIGHRIFWRLSPGLALPGIEPGEREQLLSGQRMAHLNITAFFPQNELLGRSMEVEIRHFTSSSKFSPSPDSAADHQRRCPLPDGGPALGVSCRNNSLNFIYSPRVPVLGIPLYGSNMANLEKAKARGLGLWLDKNEARDGQKLLATIRRLLDEPRQVGF
jgi:hypothetical protein